MPLGHRACGDPLHDRPGTGLFLVVRHTKRTAKHVWRRPGRPHEIIDLFRLQNLAVETDASGVIEESDEAVLTGNVVDLALSHLVDRALPSAKGTFFLGFHFEL